MGAGERPHGREPAVLAGCTKSSGRREKMLSPFPRRPSFAHDQAPEQNEKASGKSCLLFFGVRRSWLRLRTAPRRGRGKERANASDAHGSFPRRGSGGGRRGNQPAAKPGRRPGEPKGLSWGGGPSEAGWLVPPSPKEKFAGQTPQAQARFKSAHCARRLPRCRADPGAQLQLAAACARRLRGFPKRSIES
jgi:hypothetical protein